MLTKDTQEEVILMIDIMMRTGTAEAPVHKQPRQNELSGETGYCQPVNHHAISATDTLTDLFTA